MIIKPTFGNVEAYAVGRRLTNVMGPRCIRTELVGELRRGKERVHGVAVLLIPVFAGSRLVVIEGLIDDGSVIKRVDSWGNLCWSMPVFKGTDVSSGMPVDLIVTTEENWFGILVAKTGPASLTVRMASMAARLWVVFNLGDGSVKDRNGVTIHTTSEEQVFTACGMTYVDPQRR